MGAKSAYVKVIGLSGGISAAVIIGIIVYGELSRPLGGEFLERPTVQWTVGNGVESGMNLKYRLSYLDSDALVALSFLERVNDD
jgi:hypothetical protein